MLVVNDTTKKLNLQAGQIYIGKTGYPAKKVDSLFPLKGCNISSCNAKLDNEEGVYLFVFNKDYKLNYCRFFSEVTGCYLKKQKPYLVQTSVPEFNYYCNDENEYLLKSNHLAYIGSSDKVRDRIWEHLHTDKITGTRSLRLGFETRKDIKECLDLYVILTTDKNIEYTLREHYKCYFGK